METQTLTLLEIPTLTAFFMWCTILSIAFMLVWVALWFVAPELIYRLQIRFLKMPRDVWDLTFYCFLGTFKLLVLVAFVIPWIALLIIGCAR